MEKVSKTLAQHLDRISELVSRLDEHKKKSPLIERDMLLAALRDMYDAVYMLPTEDEKPVAPLSVDFTEAVLMADIDAEPLYAADPDLVAQEQIQSQMPSIEDIEGKQNDDLFEEGPEPVPEPEPEPVPEPEPEPEEKKAAVADNKEQEHPKTIWEKLNDKQRTGTIADTVSAKRTISDVYESNKTDTREQTSDNASADTKPVETESSDTTRPNATPQASAKAENKQPSLFDYFKPSAEKATPRTIADSLSPSRPSDIDSKLNASKVKDLRTVININDKFSFMNELFHNNMKGYNDFIMKLNAINERNEALEYVQNVSQQYKWDDESLTVKTFYNVFDRKF